MPRPAVPLNREGDEQVLTNFRLSTAILKAVHKRQAEMGIEAVKDFYNLAILYLLTADDDQFTNLMLAKARAETMNRATRADVLEGFKAALANLGKTRR